MGQNRENRNKSTHIQSTDLQQGCQEYEERIVSTRNGYKKIGYPHTYKRIKFHTNLLPYSDSKITMWIRLKQKAWNWKILRGKQEKYHNIGLGSDFAKVEDIRDAGLIPGPGRSPGEGNGNPLQDSCLENPKDRGTWWAMVHRVTKSWTWLKQLCTHK